MDLVWGYCGILSLGHFAFFGLGGYMIGMWLMYARTEDIVRAARRARFRRRRKRSARPSARRSSAWSAAETPVVWAFADSLIAQPGAGGVLVPGLLALVFGWLAFRSRVTGVYLSILTQAMTLALSLYLFQNDTGLRGNNGLSGLQNIPGLTDRAAIGGVGLVLLGLGAGAGAGLSGGAWVVSGKFGNRDPRHPRRRGARAVPGLSRWRPTSWSSSR
jgi:urea transport system permease protein